MSVGGIRVYVHVALRAVFGHDLDDPGHVVNLGNQVHNDAPDLPDALRVVVDVVVSGVVALALAGIDRDAGMGVALCPEVLLILARHHHHFLTAGVHQLQIGRRRDGRLLAFWLRDDTLPCLVEGIVDQHRLVLDVGLKPVFLAALNGLRSGVSQLH